MNDPQADLEAAAFGLTPLREKVQISPWPAPWGMLNMFTPAQLEERANRQPARPDPALEARRDQGRRQVFEELRAIAAADPEALRAAAESMLDFADTWEASAGITIQPATVIPPA